MPSCHRVLYARRHPGAICSMGAVPPAAAQECSATKKCATGCCSKFGFCGTTEEHCGEGCLSTCDFRLGCDANNPCPDGTCCSKFGFCGLGKDYCAPEVCVAGCKAKAQCDPGTFGAGYVELAKCPLNVCCSKWGYCGTTAEFCGDKKVKRPSCPVDSSKPMRRVVGYYEGRAARRGCQAFMPEDVPAGVYTHLNFAFASIDPVSFQIVPAQAEDVPLYSRLTALKRRDSALKVYIAIGGWSFNDPGTATFHTFSQLAADEAKQRVFFASLISFMNTYDFDGVDIDWEYPVDEERGGNAADYANFPSFLRNLRAALDASAGGRNGLTVTLPLAFWYLRHFDIAELEKSVEFFNIMSYDLHGLWDKGNKWLGAFLNSHTNMTEITEHLDLFWRNNVNPDKVTLGLAFYSRTFLAAEPGCTEAGCMFDGVGEAGPCSKDEIGGTLTNAELTDQIRAAGVTPTLDHDAMVKVAVIRRKWITYDDEDTFKLKADAARKLCLGGVMVWAVSQDYTETGAAAAAAAAAGGGSHRRASLMHPSRYSMQLQTATRYHSPKALNFTFDTPTVYEPSASILREQCYWSNCGAGCASGYSAVPRLDTDARQDEVMQDGGHCQGGRLRHFCCPSSKKMPKCGWFDFHNGKCGKLRRCPAGGEAIVGPEDRQREVGSTQIACNNGKAQLACCETVDADLKPLDSMRGYHVCRWHGRAPNSCDAIGAVVGWPSTPRHEACNTAEPYRPYYLLETLWGSGATYCKNNRLSGNDELYRPLCCEVPEPETQWQSCSLTRADRKEGNYCEASCPAGTVRLAMEKPEEYQGCKGGGHAMCCKPRFLTRANNADETHDAYYQALLNVLPDPDQCGWVLSDEESPPSLSRSRRGRFDQQRAVECKLVAQGTANMLGNPDSKVRRRYMDDWDRAVNQLGMSLVPAATMQKMPPGNAFSTAPSAAIQTGIVQHNVRFAADMHNAAATGKERSMYHCNPMYDWDLEDDLVVDVDDGHQEEITSEFMGSPSSLSAEDCARDLFCYAGMLGFNLSKIEGWQAFYNATVASGHAKLPQSGTNMTLPKRALNLQMGNPRSYVVRSNTVGAVWLGEVIQSAPYPNGHQGDDLMVINDDPHRYVVKMGSCQPDGYMLVTLASKAEAEGIWVSEHILELNTIGRYMMASLDGGLGPPPSAILTPAFSFPDGPAKPYEVQQFASMWSPWSEMFSIKPSDVCLAQLGSVYHPQGMVVCDSKLNGMKTRLYKLLAPIGETTWNRYCTSATPASLGRALGGIQLVMAVFDYYDDPNVKSRHRKAYRDVMGTLKQFTSLYDLSTAGTDRSRWTTPKWQRRWYQFMRAHFMRVLTHTRLWLTIKLDNLEHTWATALRHCGGEEGWCAFCLYAMNVITKYKIFIDKGQRVTFDYSIFDD
ncbi:hypothetical protein VTJ83DRAFT_4143 [Remersonia thermophila]|uniref:chitinase n=1 Tax=Remersonia thermophila TaxID=72144 RepID=A0ABR4D958_9PEZI